MKPIQLPSGDVRLPALHDAANRASEKARNRYLFWLRVNLCLLVSGALFASGLGILPDSKKILATVSGIAFTMGLLISLYLQQRRFEKDWYGGRAIAESVKTIAWRYMAGAEPFEVHLSTKEVDEEFTRSLRTILDQKRHLSGALDTKLDNSEQISEEMRLVRALDTGGRRDLYIKNRIRNQQSWYASRAGTNAKRGQFWFIAIIISQIAAIVSAFCLSAFPESPLNFGAVFATLSSVFLAWLQIKKHQELAQSYNLAAQELGLIAALAEHKNSDKELSEFVADAESAISREHTLWVARRD